VDRGAEHRRGAGFVGVGLDVHAELVEDAARVVQHVHDVRHRRALVAADVGHARLEQRLGDGEDRLAVEYLAVGELQLLDFLFERPFHYTRLYTNILGSQTAIAGTKNTSARSSRLIAM